MSEQKYAELFAEIERKKPRAYYWMEQAKEAIAVGSFRTAAAQKEITSHLGEYIYEIAAVTQRAAINPLWFQQEKYGKLDTIYVSEIAGKQNEMNAPRGLSEKNTAAFIDLTRKAYGPVFDDALDLIREMTRLRLAVAALPIVKPPTKAQKEREERERDTRVKHCQICNGLWVVENGKIAHHGYRRPGDGAQTASCFGAMFPPYEVSRDRVMDYIVDNSRMRLSRLKRIQQLQESDPELYLSATWYESYKQVARDLSVTPETFDQKKEKLKQEYPKARINFNADNYEALKDRALRMARRDAEMFAEVITTFTKRYNDWKPVV